MSWQEIAEDTQYMVALAPQASGLNVAGDTWEWIECAVFVPNSEGSQSDLVRGSSVYGTKRGPITGRTMHKLALKGPVKGQAAGYAESSGTPALHGLSRFLEFVGGQSAQAYQASEFTAAGSDANTIVCAHDPKVGCLLVGAEASGSRVGGFVESVTGTYTATLHEDLPYLIGDGAARAPSLTLYPKRAATTNAAYTVRIVFADSLQDRRYVGCLPVGPMRLIVEDDVLMWEVEVTCYGGEGPDWNDGGLRALTDLVAMPSFASSSRYVFGSNVFTDYDDGTADPDGSCGTRDVVLTIDFPEPFTAQGPATEGVCEAIPKATTWSVEVAVPTISDYEGSTRNALLEAWRTADAPNQAQPLSIAGYHGLTAGQGLAWLLPAAKASSRPQRVFIEGVEHYKATLVADAFAGDEDSTDAGNKPRIAVW